MKKFILYATFALVSFGKDAVIIEYDVNASNQVTAVRVINKSGKPAYMEVGRPDKSVSYSRTFNQGTTEITVPTIANARLQLTVNAKGRLDGLDGQFMFPAP